MGDWLITPQKGQQQNKADAVINASPEGKVQCELINSLLCWSCCLTRQHLQHLQTASAQPCLLPIQLLWNKVKTGICHKRGRRQSHGLSEGETHKTTEENQII